jgi:Mrp family chromosome partitioning ATPase
MGYMYNALKKASGEEILPEHIETARRPATTVSSGRMHSDEIQREFSMLKLRIRQAHAEKGTQVIGITSSVPGEGSSTVAYHLSHSLTQSTNGYASNGKKGHKKSQGVLLVDGNLDRPHLHRLFGVAVEPGLYDFAYDKTCSSLSTYRVSDQHLHLVTAGSIQKGNPDIWDSAKIGRLFAMLRKRYEYILIDAPPVIQHPETVSLAKLTDGLLLVIRANETRMEVVEEAREQLENAGVKILGAVLNERRFFIPKNIYQKI